MNGPRDTIAHHAVFEVANHPQDEEAKQILAAMCDAYEGGWSTIATRAKNRISECPTAAWISDQQFTQVSATLATHQIA